MEVLYRTILEENHGLPIGKALSISCKLGDWPKLQWFSFPSENADDKPTDLNEPCSKCLTYWHQIRKCLRHCLRLAYARTGFAYAHILSYAELTLAYAHHSFACAIPLQGVPCLTWTQGFRTWLKCATWGGCRALLTASSYSLANLRRITRWRCPEMGVTQLGWFVMEQILYKHGFLCQMLSFYHSFLSAICVGNGWMIQWITVKSHSPIL